MVSIGTGNPRIKPIAEGALKFFSETLVNIATQTEATAKIFAERHRLLYESKRLFRFNVEQGLQGVGLEEYKKGALIEPPHPTIWTCRRQNRLLSSVPQTLRRKNVCRSKKISHKLSEV